MIGEDHPVKAADVEKGAGAEKLEPLGELEDAHAELGVVWEEGAVESVTEAGVAG